MPNEEWQQVKEVFDAALRHKAEDRPAFLDEVCTNNETVRREVESLLSSYEDDSFLEYPLVGKVADAVLEERTALAGGAWLSHYQIISKLGAGGMGEVYLAEDTRLSRRVALKFLPAASPFNQEANKRLWREARAAATLDHPNICAIHEIAESEGCNFIVMQYVEGETLAERLKHKKLNLSDVLNIAVQVADALSEAHAHGIIHRDMKPANIIVNEKGQAKVLDFGLAKFTVENVEAKSQVITAKLSSKSGAIMGTVPFMSPEQVRGRRLDARTDIFSFGAMLYEMICGCSPFARETDAETISAILRDEPFFGEIPVEIQPILQKSLMKNADERYQTARDLLFDLKSLQKRLQLETDGSVAPGRYGVSTSDAEFPGAQTGRQQARPTSSAEFIVNEIKKHKVASLIVLSFLLLAIGGLGWQRLSNRSAIAMLPASATEIKSIAVLPLENLSGNPAEEYFADGMTDALINNLAQIRVLKVISRTSAMRYKGSNKSLPEIARELNVEAILEGSVHRAGGRVRVTAQLIHAATDTHLWARDYERDLTDVLKLESEIARAVADEIRIQLPAEERARLASARSVNPQAHEAYLLGRYHSGKNSAQDYEQAIEHFQRAIRLAPDYAEAYAGLSEALVQEAVFGIKADKENVPLARDAALKAIELDEQLAEAHTALGNIKYYYDWDWAGAEQEFKRALELNPASLIAHIGYGHLLHSLGRHDEAIREGQIAVQLDPLSAEAYTALGRFFYRARRYEEALPVLQRAVQLEPRSLGANSRLGSVYAELGRYEEALAVYQKAEEIAPSIEGWRDVTAYVYARMGRKEEARQMVSGLKAFPIDVAGVYAALDDKDEAFRILEEAIEQRKQQLIVLKEDPTLENLHSDPRWKELLRQMNFPTE